MQVLKSTYNCILCLTETENVNAENTKYCTLLNNINSVVITQALVQYLGLFC